MVNTFAPSLTAEEVMDVKKHATYSLPLSIWLWLKDEAARRDTDASALITELVRKEQKAA